MNRLLPVAAACAALCSAVSAATATPPAPVKTIVITVPIGTVITKTVRKTNTINSMLLTVNPQDVVTVIRTVPIDNSMHAGIPVAAFASWPTQTYLTRGDPAKPSFPDGRLPLLSLNQPIPPLSPDGQEGAFRNRCFWTRMSYDDPIVYQGKPDMAHHHTFFGHDAIDAYTTTATIRDPKNGTSCRGGSVNLSAYWVTSLIDTTTSIPMAPQDILLYYKDTLGPYMGKVMVNGVGEYPRTNVFPAGFRLISGNPGATSVPVKTEYTSGVPDWGCFIYATGTYREGTQGQQIPAACGAGDVLRVRLTFPACWDGVNLDSPDHKAHMKDVRRKAVGSVFYDPYKPLECPPTHPKFMPQITYTINWDITGKDLSKLRLSSDVYSMVDGKVIYDPLKPGGWSFHGDWMNGHDPLIQDIWVRECLGGDRGTVNGVPTAITRRDCGSATLGDTRSLIEWNGN